MPPSARRYTVVGAGAIGGYYGARLAAAGHDVRFVARSDAAHLREHGLRVESPDGDLHLTGLAVFDDWGAVPESDVVVLAVKTTDTPALLDRLSRVVAPGATVLVLQNGLGVEAPVAAAVPHAAVVGGMAFVCSNKVAPGHVRHLDYGAVTLGAHTPDGAPAGVTPEVQQLADDLTTAGIEVHPVPHLAAGRWRKLLWNIPFNGLSVVLDAGTDELMADPATRGLARALMEEVVVGAAACGVELGETVVEGLLRTTDEMTPYKTSMKLDFEAGRPLELAAIYEAPIAAARAAGADLPRTAALHAQLAFLDRRRAATPAR